MVNYNAAKSIVFGFIKLNFSESPVLKMSFETKNDYVFSIWPEGSKEPPLDPFFKVNKKTGEISDYSPLINLEEFKSCMKNNIIEKN